jgi:hypothetical protein
MPPHWVESYDENTYYALTVVRALPAMPRAMRIDEALRF